MIKDLTAEELKELLPRLVRNERKIMAEVLEHIAEVDRRRSYLDWGYSSLFAYLVEELRYSEAAANRRQSAARALHKVPELLSDVEQGTLNLSQIAMVQASIRQEEEATGQKIAVDQRKEIFEAIRSKSQIETQALLDERLPVHEPVMPVKEKHKRDESVEVTLRIPKELFARIQETRDLYSHIAPGAGWLKLLELMTADVKKLRDPKREPRPRAKSIEPATENSTHRLAATKVTTTPRPIRRFVFQRDQGKCQHIHPNGKKCESTFQVEVDHINPRFAGGDDNVENLRVLCRAHNQARYKNGAGIRPS